MLFRSEGNDETEHLVKDCIRSIWRDEKIPEDWRVNRLKIIPKKGDLHDLNNWRGIMLMESATKLLSSILASRIQGILATEGLEEQNGFMPNRGCVDGIFSLKLALQKRKEHGLGTWAVFVDLVKAFDSVPREALFNVLQKFGIPPKMCRIITSLHSDLVVKIQAGDEDIVIDSTSGVKQGCTLAPILFSVYIQACAEVRSKLSKDQGLPFKTREDHIITGRRVKTRRNVIEFAASNFLYADDGASLHESREALERECRLAFEVFRRFGLTCHVGRDGSKSKTEAMYFPPPGACYEDADTSPVVVGGGEVTFTTSFKYLGCLISSNLSDESEIGRAHV